MTAAVRIAQTSDDLVALYVPIQFLRYRLPLSRGFVEADVTVGGDSLSVHDE